MTRCRKCGGEYADGLGRCPVDGEALTSSAVPVAQSGPSKSAPTRALRGENSPPPLEELERQAPLSKKLEPGTMVGEYRITALLEEGGMGTVYAGVHPVIGKQVAIKVLSGALSDDESMTQRFIQEARAVNQIQHHNIVDIFAFGRLPDDRLYLVMELLAGRSLKERRREQAPLAYQEAISILAQVCDALAAAHAQAIVHRDLKPANIFLTEGRNQQHIVKLLDFGIAKLLRHDEGIQKTQAGVLVGTPHYMSPEQCLGKEVGARSDLYSLGIIMFELFAGTLPYSADSAIETINLHVYEPPPALTEFADLPKDLGDLVLACLAKDPDERPQSADEVRARLLEVGEAVGVELGPATGETGGTPSPRPSEPRLGKAGLSVPRGGRRTGRRRLLIGLGALVLVLALGAAGFAVFLGPEQKVEAPAQFEEPAAADDLTVQIVTQPNGATVYLNGEQQDLFTPFAFQTPRAPEVKVRLVLSGYETHETTLAFGPDEQQKALQVALQPIDEQDALSQAAPAPSPEEPEEESAEEKPRRPRGEPTTISALELEKSSTSVGEKKTLGFKLKFNDPDGDVRALVTQVHPPKGRPHRPKRIRLRLEGAKSGELSNTLLLAARAAGPHRVEVWIRDEGGNESPHLTEVVNVRAKEAASGEGEPKAEDDAPTGEKERGEEKRNSKKEAPEKKTPEKKTPEKKTPEKKTPEKK